MLLFLSMTQQTLKKEGNIRKNHQRDYECNIVYFA